VQGLPHLRQVQGCLPTQPFDGSIPAQTSLLINYMSTIDVNIRIIMLINIS